MDSNDELDQILTRVRRLWSAVGRFARNAADRLGLSAEARAYIHVNIRLDEDYQRRCRSLISRIDRALVNTEISKDAETVTCPRQHRRELLVVLPPVARCHLLRLPAELRELIFVHTVTEWMPAPTSPDAAETETTSVAAGDLVKRPIRINRFNQPCPAPITLVSQQLRAETLQLHYQENVWECWRPLFWLKDWSQSTFIKWLDCMGSERTAWLCHVVLLYKHENELEHDVEAALSEEEFVLKNCTFANKRELSEYELCFEELGLPRHFGRKHRWDQWMAGSAAT